MSDPLFRDYAKDFEELGLAPLYQKTFEELTLEEKRRVLCFEAERQDDFIVLPKMNIEDTIPKWIQWIENRFVQMIALPGLVIFFVWLSLPENINEIMLTPFWFIIIVILRIVDFFNNKIINFLLIKYKIPLRLCYKNKFSLYRLWQLYSGKERLLLQYMWFNSRTKPIVAFLLIFLMAQSI